MRGSNASSISYDDWPQSCCIAPPISCPKPLRPWDWVGALCRECVMALWEITACRYETRNARGFAVATAADGSCWEYELFEGGDGREFCSGVLERGAILSELWQQVGNPAREEIREKVLAEGA